MEEAADNAVEDFSLARSGYMHLILKKLGLAGTTTKGYLLRCFVLSGSTWLPLLILSLLQGIAYGHNVKLPFLLDFASQGKFLIIIPLLIFAEHSVDTRIIELTGQLFRSGILSENDLPAYIKIKQNTKRLSETGIADLVILLIIIFNIIIRFSENASLKLTWFILPGGDGNQISWAGWWITCFSLPVFQFILMRWFWRWIIWLIYFKKISKMPLKLSPAHSDKAGGIGFLGLPPAPFLSVTFAISILFASIIAARIFWLHERLPEYYPLMIGIALLSVIMNVVPLLVFIKPLMIQRRKGIFEYSTILQQHHRKFDEKWLEKSGSETLLGNQDASSLIDLNGSFEAVMSMRIFPFNLKTMISIIIIAILPMIPLLAFEYDWLDILKKLLGMLI